MIGLIFRFGVVGVLATFLHLAVAWGAHNTAGLPPFAANFVGFAAAFAASYVGHFFWTFRMNGGHQRHLPRFLVVSGGCYVASNIMVWLLVTVLKQSFDMALGAILLTVPPTSFLLNKLWAFREQT